MWHLSPEHLLSSAVLGLTSDKLTDVSVGTFRNGTGGGFPLRCRPQGSRDEAQTAFDHNSSQIRF